MKTLLKTESVEVTQSNRGTISFSYTDKTDAMFDLFHEYCKADDNYAALQKERDELAAYVEQIHRGINEVWSADNESRPKWWTELLQIMRHKPASCLAAHDAEVVRKAASTVDWYFKWPYDDLELINDKTLEEAKTADINVLQLLQYADSLEGK